MEKNTEHFSGHMQILNSCMVHYQKRAVLFLRGLEKRSLNAEIGNQLSLYTPLPITDKVVKDKALADYSIVTLLVRD